MVTQFAKKIKSRFKFFCGRRGRADHYFFLTVQLTKIVIDTVVRHSLQIVVSQKNLQIVNKKVMVTQFKKSRFKFFCGRSGWAGYYFFYELCNLRKLSWTQFTVNKKYWLHSSQKSMFKFFCGRRG